MKLDFIKPEVIDKSIKCSIQRTGRLGFSMEAIKKLNLKVGSGVKIATNGDDETDTNLYVILEEQYNDDTFKVLKAGLYYYIDTRILFDNLKVNYKDENKTIMFDISEFEFEGQKMYKFIKREVVRQKKK